MHLHEIQLSARSYYSTRETLKYNFTINFMVHNFPQALTKQLKKPCYYDMHILIKGRDSVDGIATRYELDGPGIEFQ